MYALTFCHEACNGNTPFAIPIAVSENRQKLVEKMRDCIEEDHDIYAYVGDVPAPFDLYHEEKDIFSIADSL